MRHLKHTASHSTHDLYSHQCRRKPFTNTMLHTSQFWNIISSYKHCVWHYNWIYCSARSQSTSMNPSRQKHTNTHLAIKFGNNWWNKFSGEMLHLALCYTFIRVNLVCEVFCCGTVTMYWRARARFSFSRNFNENAMLYFMAHKQTHTHHDCIAPQQAVFHRSNIDAKLRISEQRCARHFGE